MLNRLKQLLFAYDRSSIAYEMPTGPWVALTYDDGPHPTYTPKVLNVLEKYQVRATFFMLGEKALRYPEVVNEVLDRGHQIGTHGFAHLNYATLTLEEIRTDIQKGVDALTSSAKVQKADIRFFRPPFGYPWRLPSFYKTRAVLKVLREVNLSLALWTYDSQDYLLGSGRMQREKFFAHIPKTFQGGVCLMHDQHAFIGELTELLINLGRSKNFGFATLSDAVKF
ncbi:MAG: polysaccharide deacetylase family protein [Syntrophaceae bacterium]|nr:polysaccharide deacetylase family protein [Syntrophaceae bacterium]